MSEGMYSILKQAHSIFAYLLLLLLILTVIIAIAAVVSNKSFNKVLKKPALFTQIFSHLQLLFGLILYFVSPLGMQNFSGENMKISVSRLYMLEHPLMMLIAIILITIGYSRAKKLSSDNKKNKTIAIFYGIGLILTLSRIPWNAWPNL